jgi:CopG family transcriptional regulator / antitoxin EndoAI
MKTFRVILDDALADAVDRAATSLGTTRSAFTRDALRAALVNLQEREMEIRHQAGYERKPVKPGEFSSALS